MIICARFNPTCAMVTSISPRHIAHQEWQIGFFGCGYQRWPLYLGTKTLCGRLGHRLSRTASSPGAFYREKTLASPAGTGVYAVPPRFAMFRVNGPVLPDRVQISDDIEPQSLGEDEVVGQNSE